MHAELLRRLQERVRRSPSTDLQCVPPIQPRPVIKVEQLELAEIDLGFTLPPLIRALYLQVADGGYGPGWGILPLNIENRPSIVTHDHWMRQSWPTGLPPKGWPEPFIRFCEWGCSIYSGIDCSQMTCPVLRFDPHRGGQRDGDLFIVEADSLAEWLAAWLAGEKLWGRISRPGQQLIPP